MPPKPRTSDSQSKNPAAHQPRQSSGSKSSSSNNNNNNNPRGGSAGRGSSSASAASPPRSPAKSKSRSDSNANKSKRSGSQDKEEEEANVNNENNENNNNNHNNMSDAAYVTPGGPSAPSAPRSSQPPPPMPQGLPPPPQSPRASQSVRHSPPPVSQPPVVIPPSVYDEKKIEPMEVGVGVAAGVEVGGEDQYARFDTTQHFQCRSLEIALIMFLSIVEIIMASLWGHITGIIIGALLFFLASLDAAHWHHNNGYFEGFFNYHTKVEKAQRFIFTFLRTVFIILLLLFLCAHIFAPDPSWGDFPSSCDQVSGFAISNCARIDGVNTSLSPGDDFSFGLSPPLLNASMSQVYAVLDHYISATQLSTVLKSKTISTAFHPPSSPPTASFIHARVLSLFWGFPDDLAVLCVCEGNLTKILVHSQARIGVGDMGVNKKRVENLVTYVTSKDRQFTPAPCLP